MQMGGLGEGECSKSLLLVKESTFIFHLYTGLHFNNLYVFCLQECLLVFFLGIAIVVKLANMVWKRAFPPIISVFPTPHPNPPTFDIF